MRDDDLTVDEAADALGTSPQTIRALLRKGDLPGQKRPWGTRYVWVPSRQGVHEFLSQHGRLDGHRRRRQDLPPEVVGDHEPDAVTLDSPESAPPVTSTPSELAPEPLAEPEPSAAKPFVLRPRGRATVVVVALGVPLIGAYAAAQIIPTALWFGELGQSGVFDRVLAARIQLGVLVAGAVALFLEANLAIACRQSGRTRAVLLATVAVSVVTASVFALSASTHWPTYLLWRHRQSFGVADPIHGTDVGYFVFGLPFELLVSDWLLVLGAVATCFVVIVYRARGELSIRPPRATFRCQVHLSSLAAFFLLVVAWRLRLEQYMLELRQPSPDNSHSFSGAGYVDVHVRLPGLVVLTTLAVLLAVACIAAPFVARTASARRAALLVGIPVGLLVVGGALVAALIPALVQRYLVDPNPLLSERPFLERSIGATRSALGLDGMYVEKYSPTDSIRAADFSGASERLGNVLIWDEDILRARMRDLVTETPYYSPQEPMLDVVPVDGRPQLTVVSARQLDLRLVRGAAKTWSNDRLAYTHGLGLIRFSGTETERNRGPRLVDGGLGVREPRIYFGNRPQVQVRPADDDRETDDPALRTTTRPGAGSPWVLVDTRRPEVDLPVSDGAPPTPYHHKGRGGIELSTWFHRAAFALELRSKELLLSDDITSDSRILLHRDVNDRLQTLAPFIHWDADAVPLTANGRVVFVADGYTTSNNYPYAERVELGGTRVNYARASVRATIDAFSGRVDVYLADTSDPIARAWAKTFPTLFRPVTDMPVELRKRLRYPPELFNAQATAYERFHTTRPDLFVSDADVWSRPITLSGPLEVAGDVNFDESDEDDLRGLMEPAYAFSAPPGQTTPRVVLGTYYTPRRGQNLVATLSGWIDGQGRARLAARSLPRAPVILGPAQVSRLVFATPRVRDLLGLRNLELRDLNKSSLDTVLLGEPHLVFLSGGIIQIQSLFEGSRGAGAARLLGVTAFLGGRAGLGPDIESAVRQALNQPPRIDVVPPAGNIVVGEPVVLSFRVANASGEVVTITSSGGSTTKRLKVANGIGTVTFVPSAAGAARMQVQVTGQDGTLLKGSAAFRVLGVPPTIRLIEPPSRARVGRPLRVSFTVTKAVDELATVSTPAGIEFSRRYLIRNGKGEVNWTPKTAGPAVLIIRVRGHQGQVVTRKLRIIVEERPKEPAPPTVTLVSTPDGATVGRTSRFEFRADRCTDAEARIKSGPGGAVHTWRFTCPAPDATFTWTPSRPGDFVLTVVAHGEGGTAQVATPLRVERSR